MNTSEAESKVIASNTIWTVYVTKWIPFLFFFKRKKVERFVTRDSGTTWVNAKTDFLVQPGSDDYIKFRKALADYGIEPGPELKSLNV
jgi:hypothetical protein